MSETSQETDADLVFRILEDKNNFGELISRYQEKLGRYIRRLGVREEEDVLDLLQEIFIKIYINLNNYDSARSFSAWAYRIAHNEVVSWFRKRNVRPEGHLADESEAILERMTEDCADDFSLHGYDRKVVLRAVEALPEKYQSVIILRYFEEYDYSEISDILEMPMGSVATNLSRGKAKLKKTLASLVT